jgi:hypothetical protein
MGLVALTIGCLLLGAFHRPPSHGGARSAFFVGAFICIIGLNFAMVGASSRRCPTPEIRP